MINAACDKIASFEKSLKTVCKRPVAITVQPNWNWKTKDGYLKLELHLSRLVDDAETDKPILSDRVVRVVNATLKK